MDQGQDHAADLPVVIGIASSLEDKVRLTQLLDDFGPLVLVSTFDEARALLDGGASANGLPDQREGPARSANGLRVKTIAGIEVDSDLMTATCHKLQVSLTPLEHDLLLCLANEPRRTWTHAALREAVWNTSHGGADIHSVVKRLRRKLAALRAPATIDAIRGVGFRLSEPPESVGWP